MSELKIKTDGDPYPIQAGAFNLDGTGAPGTTTFQRNFRDGSVIQDQDKEYRITYRGGQGGSVDNGVATVLDGNPESVYTDESGVFREMPIGVTTWGVVIYPPGIKSFVDSNGFTITAPLGLTFNTINCDDFHKKDQRGGKPEGPNGEYRYRSNAFLENIGIPSPGEDRGNSVNVTAPYISGSRGGSGEFYHPSIEHDGVVFTENHSKILGFAFDGYPIYGPMGYSDPIDPTSNLAGMRSSYRLIRPEDEEYTLERQALIVGDDTVGRVARPLGSFIEDYKYDPGFGDLDEHNGRFCITPDYKQGTYAYFITFESTGNTDGGTVRMYANGDNPTYPYIIGTSTKQRRSY